MLCILPVQLDIPLVEGEGVSCTCTAMTGQLVVADLWPPAPEPVLHYCQALLILPLQKINITNYLSASACPNDGRTLL